MNSHEPITNYLLGNLLALTKHNYTAAQEYYRRALSIDPTHIYAHRQLRLSYCYAMYTAWETVTCSNDKDKCDKGSVPSESTNNNLMLSNQNYKPHETTMPIVNTASYMSYHYRNTQCMT